MSSGPDILGCRPVLVSFEFFKDRFDVLASSRLVDIVNYTVYDCYQSAHQSAPVQTVDCGDGGNDEENQGGEARTEVIPPAVSCQLRSLAGDT